MRNFPTRGRSHGAHPRLAARWVCAEPSHPGPHWQGAAFRTRGAAPRRLKVMESLMLDPRRRLVVVRFDDRDHLLLLSPAGDKTVTDVAAPAHVSEEPQT